VVDGQYHLVEEQGMLPERDFVAGVMLATIAWLVLIYVGLLPQYTDQCPNGRYVYIQSGHRSDKEKLCGVLQ
jgi:hypothetical protein